MITIEEALIYRQKMVEGAQRLSDEEALSVPMLFDRWATGISYDAGTRLYFGGTLYRVLQSHTSQVGWEPDVAVSLFARVLIPDPEVIPDWEQPDSTNPYMSGDKVRYGGKVWISIIDNNVWAPGVYGWEEVAE